VVEQADRVGCESVAEHFGEPFREGAGAGERVDVVLLFGFRGGVEERDERSGRRAAAFDVLFDLGELVGHRRYLRGQIAKESLASDTR